MKKHYVQPFYISQEPKLVSWEEGEELAFWEGYFYALSMRGDFGELAQIRATFYGFPVWTEYFANPKTCTFFLRCEELS